MQHRHDYHWDKNLIISGQSFHDTKTIQFIFTISQLTFSWGCLMKPWSEMNS